MKFGEMLRTLRKEHGMTQHEVADTIGVARRTYLSWETEGRIPRNDAERVYAALANLYGYEPNEFYALVRPDAVKKKRNPVREKRTLLCTSADGHKWYLVETWKEE